jgi:hypothetical protein
MAIEKDIQGTIKNVLQYTNAAIDAVRKPANALAAYLVYATAVMRPGISKTKITSEIIADNAPLGINTGQMPDGTDNVVNEFVCNVVEKVVDTLKDDAMIECVIPAGSVIVTAKGSNAGGPVIAVGTNTNNAKGYGIIR